MKSISLDELTRDWSVDGGELNNLDPIGETVRLAKCHAKYMRLWLIETSRLRRADAEYKQFKHAKAEWYMGTMPQEELKERNWKPYQGRILKADVSRYVDSDPEVVAMGIRLGDITGKAEFLEMAIKQLNSLGFSIKNIIEWNKFQAGG